MGVMKRFEQRLEGLVNGTFAKVFKSEAQPVEIAGALQRECDNNATIWNRQRTVVPNDFIVELSTPDYERLSPYSGSAGRRALRTGARLRQAAALHVHGPDQGPPGEGRRPRHRALPGPQPHAGVEYVTAGPVGPPAAPGLPPRRPAGPRRREPAATPLAPLRRCPRPRRPAPDGPRPPRATGARLLRPAPCRTPGRALDRDQRHPPSDFPPDVGDGRRPTPPCGSTTPAYRAGTVRSGPERPRRSRISGPPTASWWTGSTPPALRSATARGSSWGSTTIVYRQAEG
ncbi:hypothetical protein SBADM41S_03682 [Streptomyces badius]